MHVGLGIDTGGTYTDAVLIDQTSGQVLIWSKALTTPHDLSLGIGQAVSEVLRKEPRLPSSSASEPTPPLVAPADIEMVALSTTLATNAIVEGHGGTVCLLLIGYDRELIRQYGYQRHLVTQDVVYLGGGHDVMGNEVEPLDEESAREAILGHHKKVDAFAVSGYFAVRNPAHELRVKALIEKLTDRPSTCGHELTTRLNSVHRATATVLNARLIPLLRELIAAVRRTLHQQDISAPLMVVRGDGSLVRAEWALERPVETVLSGPAASVVGARHLAGPQDAWVVDVGGTTTDIALLRDGRPGLNPEGARVGDRRVMVETVDVYTTGLGGDSHVRVDRTGQVLVGPQRAVPLALLASEHPETVDQLQHQLPRSRKDELIGEFAWASPRTSNAISDAERAFLSRVEEEVWYLPQLLREPESRRLTSRQIENLQARGLLMRAAFTPTDALHVLGQFTRWNAEAPRLAAELLASQAGASPQAFCQQVVAALSEQIAKALVGRTLSNGGHLPRWEEEPTAQSLVNRALRGEDAVELRCQLNLRRPIVAIGAPVTAYMPRVAELLRTELVIPPHAEVASAVGAVAGSVAQRLTALIHPLEASGLFRLHAPDGVHDFPTVQEAVAYAEKALPTEVEALAQQAGAGEVEVRMSRRDRRALAASGWEQEVYLGTELVFTAVGRPSSARASSDA